MSNSVKALRDFYGLTVEGADNIADEIERLEKERFKYETCLMLISNGYRGAAELALAAISKPSVEQGTVGPSKFTSQTSK